MKRYEDPKWVQSMKLSLDHNYAMAEFVGENGLKEADLQGLAPRLEAFHQDLAARRQSGEMGFMELPYQSQVVKEVRQVAKPLLEWCWDVVVLGVGGSALGARALHQALCHPQHNKFPMARRHLKLGLWVADNIDPDALYGLLDGLDMRRTAFNVVSKSGPYRRDPGPVPVGIQTAQGPGGGGQGPGAPRHHHRPGSRAAPEPGG